MKPIGNDIPNLTQPLTNRKRFVRMAIAGALLAMGIGMQACAPKPEPEPACDFVQNGDGQRVSWGSSVPVILYVDASVTREYFSAIQKAVEVWNRTLNREVLKIGGWTNTNAPLQDGYNVIYMMNEWEADRSREQARTTVYWAGSQIYEADVRINAKDYQFFTGDRAEGGKIDFESLLVHEFGHVLGLSHVDDGTQSVMLRELPYAQFRRTLSALDQKSISCEY